MNIVCASRVKRDLLTPLLTLAISVNFIGSACLHAEPIALSSPVKSPIPSPLVVAALQKPAVVPSASTNEPASAPVNIVLGSQAVVAASPERSERPVPEVLEKMMRGQGKILSSFSVDGLPLTGWSVQPDPNTARGEIIYTTSDGRYAFVGQVLSVNLSGNVFNEGARLQEEHGPKIDLGYVWALLAKTTFIKEGPEDAQAKIIVYGFMDPNCVYCHQSWKLLEPYTKQGLQVRWIPVGVIDPKTSKEKAAALIEAKDPLSAFVASYRNWDSKHGDAFEAVKTISPVTQAKLDANTQVLAQMGARGTPAFIFKDGEGKINRIQGAVTAEQMPSIMKATIPGSVIAPAGAPTALSAY